MPVKFDDISKVANSMLMDDFQTSGYQLKAKQKTSWYGSTVTSAIDVLPPGGKDAICTPAKLTWKFPKPFGFDGVIIDKLEMDKSGKMKLECCVDKNAHKRSDLVIEAKSDLAKANNLVFGAVVTSVADTRLALETKALDPANFTADLTRTFKGATFGVKFGKDNLSQPDVGARFEQGPMFGSLLVKKKFTNFTVHGLYTVNDDLKVAATVDKTKDTQHYSAGFAYRANGNTTLKVKVSDDKSVSAAVKHEVSKGFTVIAGAKYSNSAGTPYTTGLQLSIE